MTDTRASPLLGYTAPLPPTRFNLARYCLVAGARTHPDKSALVVIKDAKGFEQCEVWTYRALEDAVLKVAGALRETGLQSGDRILIQLENTSTYAILFFGAIAGGFVPLPTSTQLTRRELQFLIEDAEPKLIAHASPDTFDHSSAPMVLTAGDIGNMIASAARADYADTAANDPAYLIYTSGTTANPKGVLHAHRAAWGRRPMYDGWYGITSDDRMLHAGAFNWTYTLGTGLIDPWANGATAFVCTGQRDVADWPDVIRNTGATLFAAVPGVFRQILKYAELGSAEMKPLAKLRHGLMAGEAPPPELIDDWQATTGTPLYEALGMSEISTYISTGPATPPKVGTIGKAQTGRCIAILSEDETTCDIPLVAGESGLLGVHRSDPGLMLGYWNRPEEDAEVRRGDWFVGGDRAMIDVDGYLTHLGRANDVMKALGYRVAPQEVEAVLLAHPEITETAVTEIAVRSDVSVIVAFVVAQSHAKLTADDVIAFAGERLASYKTPREVVFVDVLPRTSNGKIRRAALSGVYTKKA